MIHDLKGCRLRPPSREDVQRLFEYKNDVEVGSLLVGFHSGYSLAGIEEWIEFHRRQRDEIVWTIAGAKSDECLGHVGLYQIDHRVGCADFSIMIGHKPSWGQGIGRTVTSFVVAFAFDQLNLHRVQLRVLATNERAIHLYRTLGFKDEGCLRHAQYKNGEYIDVLQMAILEDEFVRA